MKKQLIVSYIESKDVNQAEDNLSKVFNHLSFEYKHFSSLIENEVPQFAIIDNVEKMDQLRGIFEPSGQTVQFVFVGRNYKVQEFFDLNGAIIVDPSLYQLEIVSRLIKRSLLGESEIHLEEIFNKNFEKYFSYKISNLYRLGYFADLLCKDAAQQKFNFVSIRTFFDHAMLLNSYLVNLGLATFPCEMEFAFKDNQFVLLLHLSTNGLKQNHLIESLGQENNKNPLTSLLKTCFKQSDYLDVMNYPKAKRLSIIGVWVSEEQRAEISTSSISIKTVDDAHHNRHVNESGEFNYDFNHQSDPKDLEKLDKGQVPTLPGTHKTILEVAEDSIFKNEEGLLQEITSFVQNQVELKNLELDDPSQAVSMSDLSLDEVKQILKDYPDQELVQKFKKGDEQLLTSLVVSGNAAEELIQVVSNKVAKEEEELTVRLSSGAEEITNQITMKGGLFQEKIDNEVQFIASSKAREKNITEVIQDPGVFLEDAEFELAGSSVELNEDEKRKISENIKDVLIKLSTEENFLALSPEAQQETIEEQVQQVVRSSIPKVKQMEIIKGAHNKPPVDDDIKIAMGSIEEELVTKFSSNTGPVLIEDQIEVITSAILKNAKNVKTVLSGDKSLDQSVEEIIEQMNIPEEQKNAFKQKVIVKNKKSSSQSLDNEESFFSADESGKEHVEVVSGSNSFPTDAGYKVNNKKKTHSELEDDSQLVDGNVNSDDGFKLKISEGSKQQDDGYKVSVGGNNAGLQGSQYNVSENSHLINKIEELEKKIQSQKEHIREMSKVQVKDLKSEDIKIDRPEMEHITNVTKEIKEMSGISDLQKEKMLQIIDSEQKMHEKYNEMQEAYRKNKILLDTQTNNSKEEMEALERDNRHKDLMVAQMKTKITNLEKDTRVEIKRISFELKKQQQRVSMAESDSFRQKIHSLEKEKNNIKRTLDELKANISIEKNKTLDLAAQSSPKVSEAEAQRKRAEVKLLAANSEIAELKKAIHAKESTAKEVGEQRIKFESEANKWKKDALTRQSELEKVQNEKNKIETELASVRRRLEDHSREIKIDKKSENKIEQTSKDTKVTNVTGESPKQIEDKILQLKEEMNKEKSHLNKELAKSIEQFEQMKKSYLMESNKVKALEVKAKEMADQLAQQASEIKAHETAEAEVTTKATAGAGSASSKDISALTTKNRILEETSKKITKDFNETKVKLDDAKKEIAILTKKNNEISFKLQEKEKLSEKLQNELKSSKEKDGDSKKKAA